MKIYNIPAKPLSSIEFQPIDLDYIVSIGPVTSANYECYFLVYIKIGQPIPIRYESADYDEWRERTVGYLNAEREKLIEAWKNNEPSE